MSTADELAHIDLKVMDIFFSRKIMPVILEQTKNLFGNAAPIFGAAGTTMFISIMPPGQGPCLHSHNDTFETLMVLDGTIAYFVGDHVEPRITLDKWDLFSCPPRVYRGFRTVGTAAPVKLPRFTGLVDYLAHVS